MSWIADARRKPRLRVVKEPVVEPIRPIGSEELTLPEEPAKLDDESIA